jgi:hypothetical protein
MKTLSFLLAAALIISATSASAQQLIYSDNLQGSYVFSGQGYGDSTGADYLSASTPTIWADAAALGGSTSANWQALATYGNAVFQRTPNGAHAYNGNESAWLAFNPVAGNVYTLTLDVAPYGGSNSFAVGFTQNIVNSGDDAIGDSAYGTSDFVTLSGQGDTGQPPTLTDLQNGGSFSGTFAGGNAANSVSQTVTITLDTTGALWKGGATLSGTGSTLNFTFAANPTINYVGFGGNFDPTIYSNFMLTAADVPEPSSTALMFFGVGALAFVVRRRLAKI